MRPIPERITFYTFLNPFFDVFSIRCKHSFLGISFFSYYVPRISLVIVQLPIKGEKSMRKKVVIVISLVEQADNVERHHRRPYDSEVKTHG